jgi:hypothetical protein
MRRDQLYYRPSGGISVAGQVYVFLAGLVITVLLSAVYGYVMYRVPILIVRMLIPPAFGAVVGFAITRICEQGEIRSTGFVLSAAFAFGLLADYAGWVSWIFVASEQRLFAVLPSDVLSIIVGLAREGEWELVSWTLRGVALYVVWTIEAVTIVAASVVAAATLRRLTPYCERCHRWVEKLSSPPLEPVPDPVVLRSQLERGDFTSVIALEPVDAASTFAHAQMDLLQCPRCEDFHLLSVRLQGVLQERVVENLIIPRSVYRQLLLKVK